MAARRGDCTAEIYSTRDGRWAGVLFHRHGVPRWLNDGGFEMLRPCRERRTALIWAAARLNHE